MQTYVCICMCVCYNEGYNEVAKLIECEVFKWQNLK